MGPDSCVPPLVGVVLFLLLNIPRTSTQVCSSLDFRCRNMKCLPMNKKCDRIDDCGDRSDELNCVAPNMSLALIWTTTTSRFQLSSIHKIFGDPEFYLPKLANNITNDLGVIIDNLDSPHSGNLFDRLSYDLNNQLLFFTNSRVQAISFGSYIYNNQTTFYNFNPTKVSNQVSGLSLDWGSYALYWVDGFYKRICVVSLNLILMWRPIVETDLNSPQDVVANPKSGHLFWSDAGSNPKIERSSLDGLDRRVLVSSSRLVSPSTLTVDFEGQRLFWLDSGAGSVGSVGFDGSDINVWRHSDLRTAASFALYKNFLFVGDKLQPRFSVYKVNGSFNFYTTVSLINVNGVIDMTFYSKSNQPDVISLCKILNGGCSHFCFTVPPLSRSCQCSVGFVPGPDNINCTIEPFHDNFVVVADTQQRNVFQVRPETGEVRALLPHSDRFPTAVDFDFLHNYVYWIDNKTNAIGKTSLDGRLYTHIFQYTSAVARISGIAVDPARELLYCTDPSLGRIIQMSTIGSDSKLIYVDSTSRPQSIAIDITSRHLYWSDCGRSPAIRRARTTLDGLEEVETIVSQNIGCPSIAIDSEIGVIFWSDDSSGQVWKAKVDGSERTLVYTERQIAAGSVTSIAITRDNIFVSNNMIQWLTKIDRNTLQTERQRPTNLFLSPGGVATSDSSYRFPETFDNDFLVVIDASEHRRNLYQIEVETGEMIPLLLTRPINPVALAFDMEERTVYWTDVVDRCIGKFTIDGSRGDSTIIFQDISGGAVMDGLALDALNGKLYYSDAGVSSKVVEMNLNGTEPVTIVQDATMKPRALVIDVKNRELYCTDWGDLPGIYKISISAKQRTRILGDDLVWPNALAIDFQEQVMYWADANIDRIEMANLDGSGRVTIITEVNVHYFAIALSPEYLYITDWSHDAVRKLDRRTHQITEQKPKIFGKLMGIIYYNSSLHEGNGSHVVRSPRNRTTRPKILLPRSSSTTTPLPSKSTSAIFDINRSSSSTKYRMPEHGDATKKTEPSAIPSGKTDMVKPGDGTTLHPLSQNHEGTLKIDHTTVIIIAVIVGGVVLMTGLITLGVCCVAKKKRSRASAITDHYQRPDRAVVAYSTSSGTRSSNTYEYIPYATSGIAASGGEGGHSFNEDYLKPVDDYSKTDGVYFSIKDEDAKVNLLTLGGK